MSTKKQYFNIKYPFTKNNDEGIFIDLNESNIDDVRSKILHLLFTPKGQRYRLPDFGTNLISYIFNSNESMTWSEVTDEIKNSVSKYIPNAVIREIQILENEEHSIAVSIEFGVKRGNILEINKEVIKLT